MVIGEYYANHIITMSIPPSSLGKNVEKDRRQVALNSAIPSKESPNYSVRCARVRLSSLRKAFVDSHREVLKLRAKLRGSDDECLRTLEAAHERLTQSILRFAMISDTERQTLEGTTVPARAFSAFRALASMKNKDPQVAQQDKAPEVWLEGYQDLENLASELSSSQASLAQPVRNAVSI